MSDRLLSTRFGLHDVRDVEGLCWSILERTVRRGGGYLEHHQKRDLVQHLMRIAWELSGLDERGRLRTAWVVEALVDVGEGEPETKRVCVIHDRAAAAHVDRIARALADGAWWVRESTPPPGCWRKGAGPSFSTYATRILVRRIVDWYRSELGDSRYGQRPHTLSLDAVSEATGVSIAELVGPDMSVDEEEVLTRVSSDR